MSACRTTGACWTTSLLDQPGNTLFLGSITLAIEFVIAMALAALVYRDRWVKAWRICFMLPMLFMPSAVAYLWKLLFNDGRVIGDLLIRIGFADRQHRLDGLDVSTPASCWS